MYYIDINFVLSNQQVLNLYYEVEVFIFVL